MSIVAHRKFLDQIEICLKHDQLCSELDEDWKSVIAFVSFGLLLTNILLEFLILSEDISEKFGNSWYVNLYLAESLKK